MRAVVLAFACLTTGVASCTAPDAVTFRIVEALKLAPPECLGAAAQARDDVTLLDIGFDEANANNAHALLRLDLDDANDAGALITITTSETVLRGAPDGAPRRLGVSGGTANEAGGVAPRDRVFATIVTSEDAVALQSDIAVVAALRGPDDRVRVDVDVVLEGFLNGTGPDIRDDEEARLPPPSAPNGVVRSPVFTLPLDLCVGCLLPRCAAGEVAVPVDEDGVCLRGQDAPFTCRIE